MIDSFPFLLTAFWLGILVSISPCPLATNIAAISFVSYRVTNKGMVLLSSFFYTIGRSITYAVIGFLIVKALVNVPILSDFLQRYINKLMGPLLILIGVYLLGFFRIKVPSLNISDKAHKQLQGAGLVGSLLLGALFALAFCPVAAALFFGSLIPLTVQAKSSIGLPLIFGVGTGLPVLCFAFIVALGSNYLDKIYHGISKIELYARKITGVIFICVGIYYILSYLLGIS